MRNNTLTPVETIKERLREAYDAEYHRTLYRQTLYCLGEKWNVKVPNSIDGATFPVFPNYKVKLLAVGQSRRILNSQFINLSKVMYNAPEPECPQVHKWTSEIRKQAYLARYRGRGYADGSWGDQDCPMYLDGVGTGVGFKQWGVRTNPETGYKFVDSQYVPCYNVIWPREAKVPSRARYMAFVNYLPAEEAKRLYGKKAEDHIQQYYGTESGTCKQVRVFEYFDVGSEDGRVAPTKAVFLGEMSQDPVVHTENEWGCIPMSHYVHFVAPGMDRPIGAIGMQMASQEALNDLEKYMRAMLKSPGFRLIDLTQVHPDDVSRISSGNMPEYVRFTPDKESKILPISNVPGMEVGAWFGMALDMLNRQFTVDSGQNDMDRGNQLESDRTLGEAQLLDARSQNQGAWSELQAEKMHIRGVEKSFKIMELGDRDPMMLDVFGHNIPINVPGVPESYISAFLVEKSSIIIDSQQLKKSDLERERAQRIANLRELTAWVGRGVDPTWFVEELLKATGETDPKEAMMTQAMPGQPQMGMPGDMNTAMAGGPAPVPVAA